MKEINLSPLLLALLVGLSACKSRSVAELSTPPVPEPNFLVLVIDALRADHLGCMGYARDTTPTLDRLAARGVLFTDNTSPSSYTRASVPSIFTGFLPGAHGMLSKSGPHAQALSDRFVTIAELLKERSYATAAFMPNPSLHRKFNFDQGFDRYEDDIVGRREGLTRAQVYETATKIQRAALEWLDGIGRQPFFLYLHYRDVHAPYVPPRPYHRRYWPKGTEKSANLRLLSPGEYADMPEYMRLPKDHGTLDYYVAQYDGEIRYTDDRIAELLAELERRGLLDRTILFVTSDHGESFLDHGSAWGHGNGLYQEELHSPLIMVNPGFAAGRRVDRPVQTLDILPTIVDFLDASGPEGMQGRSLLETAEHPQDEPRVVSAETQTRQMVRRGSWKLIRESASSEVALYDLATDPGERRSVAAERVDVVREFGAELERLAARNAEIRSHHSDREIELDPQHVEQLKALGYVE